MDGGLAPASANSAGSPVQEPSLLVINLEGDSWNFLSFCRRYCFDLYRLRSKIEFWDVTKAERAQSNGGADEHRIWKHWPKVIHGGVPAAVAEFEEKLGEFVVASQGAELLTVVLLAGRSALSSSNRDQDEGLNVPAFQRSLSSWFDRNQEKKRRIRLVLLLPEWGLSKGSLQEQGQDQENNHPYSSLLGFVRGGNETSRNELAAAFDAILIPDRLQLQNGQEFFARREGNILFIRAVLDILLSKPVTESLYRALLNVDVVPLKRVIEVRIISGTPLLARTDYAATIINAIETVHNLTNKQFESAGSSSPADPFQLLLKETLDASQRIAAAIDVSQSFLFPKQKGTSVQPPEPIGRRLVRRVFGKVDVKNPAWSLDQQLSVKLNECFVEYLTELNNAINEGMRASDGTFLGGERAAVSERRSQEARIDRLTLASFGAGGRASDNYRNGVRLTSDELKRTEQEIVKFWTDFFGESHAVSTKDKSNFDNLFRQSCPLIPVHWKEVQTLLKNYERADYAADQLKESPPIARWAVVAASLFLSLPLLWLLAILGGIIPGSIEWPLAGLLFWVGLFLCSLTLPNKDIRDSQRNFQRCLGSIDDSAQLLTNKIDRSLKEIAAYVGKVQRNHFLKELLKKIQSLSDKARFFDQYLSNAKNSISLPMAQVPARESESHSKLDEVLSRRDYDDWLTTALEIFDVINGPEIGVTVFGSVEQKVSSTMFRNQLRVSMDNKAG